MLAGDPDNSNDAAYGQVDVRVADVGAVAIVSRPGGVPRDAGDIDPACIQLDDEQHMVADQPVQSEHLDGEEVGGGHGRPLGLQERLPTRLR